MRIVKPNKAISILVLLCVSLPAVAVNVDKPEVKQSKADQLRTEIASLAEDTLKLRRKIEAANKQINQNNQNCENVWKQIDDLNRSFCPDTLARYNEMADALKMKVDELGKQLADIKGENKKKKERIVRLKNEQKQLDVYAQINLEQRLAKNEQLLKERYSQVNGSDYIELCDTAKYARMPGYEKYRQRVKHFLGNKRIYDAGNVALRSPFNGDTIQHLKAEVGKALETKGGSKLLVVHRHELDTLKTQLTRYENGIKFLQKVVNNVNGNEEIKQFRETQQNRTECLEKMKSIIFEDNISKIYKQDYFDVIPYLGELLVQYWKELQMNPFKTAAVENTIKQLMRE